MLTILLLEVISFFLLFLFVYFSGSYIFMDYLLIVVFSLFVIEGVLALSGLVVLVRFSGSDYVSSSTFFQF